MSSNRSKLEIEVGKVEDVKVIPNKVVEYFSGDRKKDLFYHPEEIHTILKVPIRVKSSEGELKINYLMREVLYPESFRRDVEEDIPNTVWRVLQRASKRSSLSLASFSSRSRIERLLLKNKSERDGEDIITPEWKTNSYVGYRLQTPQELDMWGRFYFRGPLDDRPQADDYLTPIAISIGRIPPSYGEGPSSLVKSYMTPEWIDTFRSFSEHLRVRSQVFEPEPKGLTKGSDVVYASVSPLNLDKTSKNYGRTLRDPTFLKDPRENEVYGPKPIYKLKERYAR